jgi:SAM-dependent methyltransferase
MGAAMLRAAVGAVHGTTVLDRRKRVLSDAIERLLPAGSLVLDVGTGDGQIASRWRQACSGLSVEGIDVLVRGRTHIPVSAFDGRTIPYPDKSVDVVTFVDVLHHTEDAQLLLSEAARVARRSIVIKDHLAETPLDHWTLRLMDWVGNAPHGVVLPYNYLSYETWMLCFERAGLQVVSFEHAIPLYPFPLNLVFGRKLHFVAQLRPAAGSA